MATDQKYDRKVTFKGPGLSTEIVTCPSHKNETQSKSMVLSNQTMMGETQHGYFNIAFYGYGLDGGPAFGPLAKPQPLDVAILPSADHRQEQIGFPGRSSELEAMHGSLVFSDAPIDEHFGNPSCAVVGGFLGPSTRSEKYSIFGEDMPMDELFHLHQTWGKGDVSSSHPGLLPPFLGRHGIFPVISGVACQAKVDQTDRILSGGPLITPFCLRSILLFGLSPRSCFQRSQSQSCAKITAPVTRAPSS